MVRGVMAWQDVPFKIPPRSFGGRARVFFINMLCSLGIALFGLARRFRKLADLGAPRKILIVRRGGLGDTLAATALVRALRENYPSANLSVLIGRQAVAVLEGNADVNRIFTAPSSKREWFGLLRALRREQFDTAFILHRYFVPSLLAVAAGIPRRLGFYWKRHGFALTAGIPFDPRRSQVKQIVQLMTLLGKPAPEPKLHFDPGPAQRERASSLLREWGYDPARPLIGIHPGGCETAGSSEPARRWLPERFGQLADLLSTREGAQVLLLQGPGDEPFVSATLSNMTTQPLRVVSGLDLGTFSALLGACGVVIANDSGPMHIAAAQGAPVVAIFGPSHPGYNPPLGDRHKVSWAGVSCSPCYNPDELAETIPLIGKKVFTCWLGTHECMKAITAEEVYVAVKERLEALKSSR